MALPGGAFEAMVASVDGQLLAAATTDGIILFTMTGLSSPRKTGMLRKRSLDKISVLEFSADKQFLLSGSEHGMVQLWELSKPLANDTPTTVFDSGHMATQLGTLTQVPINIIHLADDQSSLVTASTRWVGGSNEADLSAKVWTLKNLHRVGAPRLLPHKQAISSVSYIESGRAVVTTSLDGTVQRWSLQGTASSPKVLATPLCECNSADSFKNIYAAAVAPNKQFIATAASDEAIRLINLTDAAAKPTELRGFDTMPEFLTISRSGKWLVSGDGTLRLWNLKQEAPDNRAIIAGNWQTHYQASLLSSSGNTAALIADNKVEVWDLSALNSPRQLPSLPVVIDNKSNCLTCMVNLSPDGKWLVVQSDSNKNTSIVRSADGVTTFTIPVRTWSVTSESQFSPDSRWLLVNESKGGRLYALTRTPYSVPLEAPDTGARAYFSAPSFAVGSEWIYGKSSLPATNFASSREVVYLWQIDSQRRRTQRFDIGEINKFASMEGQFSPDGAWFAYSNSRSSDTRVSLVRLPRRGSKPYFVKLTGHEFSPSTLVFSPDSSWLLTGTNDILVRDSLTQVRIWNLRNPDPEQKPMVLPRLTKYLRTAQFSPDGHFLVTVTGTDDFARLWNLDESGNQFVFTGILRGPTPKLNHYWEVVFSPDSKRVVLSTNDDTTPFLWFLTTVGADLKPIQLRTGVLELQQMRFASDSKRLFVSSSSRSFIGGKENRGGQLLMFDVQNQNQEIVAQEVLSLPEEDMGDFRLMQGGKWILLAGKRVYGQPVRDGIELISSLGKAIGRNMTWDDWVRSGLSGAYHKTFKTLPVHQSVLIELTGRVSAGDQKAPGGVPIDTVAQWALDLDDPELCHNLASALAASGESQLSLRLVSRALKHFPNEAAFLDTQKAAQALPRN